MGGGGSSVQPYPWPTETPAEIADVNAAFQGAANQAQQFMAGVQQNWLMNYGQTSAMAAAGIPAPFSTISGGFHTPFMSPSGTPTGGAAGALIGGR